MPEITGRDRHLITKALAGAISIYSRGDRRHVPGSDADEMATLYLSMTDDRDRLGHQHGIQWLLSGGFDLRPREPEPWPSGGGLPPGRPLPDGGEPLPIERNAA